MPKTVVDLARDVGKRTHTFMSYGPSRSGKTRFAGSFPRPLFLSDKSEKGWETLRYMPDSVLYEPERRPEVWAIGHASEMVDACREVAELVKKEPDRVRTLVIDSLTFYADSYFSAIEGAAYDNVSTKKRPEGRQLYGDLASHLRYLMIKVHELPLNVVWICLERPPSEDHPYGGVLLAGQTADKAPARCDFIFYHRTFQRGPDQPTVFEIRTKKFGAYIAGGRDGGILPDPLPDCTYRTIEQALYGSAASSRKDGDAMARRSAP